MITSFPELDELIKDLRSKDLLSEEEITKFKTPPDDLTFVRCTLLASLDVSVAVGAITLEQAEPYIARIGYTPDEIRDIRSGHWNDEERKRRLN